MSEPFPTELQPERTRAIHCEMICDSFEAAWRDVRVGSDRPMLEDFLAQTSESERESLLRELVVIEIDYRHQIGESPSHDEYGARFPALSSNWFRELLIQPATLPFEARRVAVSDMSGRAFGDYELLTEIARGGMGIVYKARQVSLNRIVALKMILAGSHASDADVLRFRAEAEAAANLDDPGIVPIYEVGQHDGHYFFSMGYIEGQSLAARLVEGPLVPREAAEIVRDAARAVHYAHQAGVIHRDLKPANILIDRTNRPRVTDFGLAKRTANESSLTASGQVLGTPSYMPPEQACGKVDEAGPKADVYSLGAVLYATLTGRPPFQAATAAATLQQVLDQEPAALCAINKSVPRDLETIALKCLEKLPQRRYASAEELAEDLDRWLTGQTILARRSRAWERALKWARRRPAVAALSGGLATVTVVAFILVTWLWLSSQRVATRRTLDTARIWCEEGEVNRGLLLLDHTLGVVPFYGKDLDHAIRANIGTWQKQLVPLVSLLPNPGAVQYQVFSTDGRRLLRVYKNRNETTEIWDVEQGKPIRSLKHSAPIRRFAVFSPDGNRILIATEDGDKGGFCLWRVNEEHVPEPCITAGLVTAAAFAPDGKTVVTGCDDHALQAWDSFTGKELTDKSTAAGAVVAVAVSDDGQTVATGTDNGKVQLWKADSLLPAGFELEAPQLKSDTGKVRTVAFALGGKRLLALIQDEQQGIGDVPVWDITNGCFVENLNNTPWEIKAVAISRDGRSVLTGAGDYTAQLWEIREQTLTVKAVLQHEDDVDAVAFSPDEEGKLVLTGSKDGTTRVWDATTGKPVCLPVAHPGPVQTVVFSEGAMYSTISQDASVRMWKIPSAIDRGWSEDGKIMSLAVSPDGKRVATGTNNGNVHVHKTDDGTPEWEHKCHDDEVWAIAFLTYDKLATGGRHGTIRVWDVGSNTPIHEFEETYRVRSLAGSPDGDTLLIGSGDWVDGQAGLRRISNDDAIDLPLLRNGVVDAVTYSPKDGVSRCAVASGNAIQLWLNLPKPNEDDGKSPSDDAVVKGGFVELLPPHEVRVVALAFSPDGSRLASGSIDKTVRLWDGATGTPQGQALRHASAVWSVAFSFDGKFLVTGCSDGSVHVWDVATGVPVGPTWHHEEVAWTVRCDSEGRIWSGGNDQMLRQWPLPSPVEGSPRLIRLGTEVFTGMDFDSQQVARWLDAATWQQRREALDRLVRRITPK